MGNLMPEDFKDQMKNILDEYPGITQIASLCPTPEEICKFNDLRSEILGGRATPDQLLQMCEPNDDLADLSQSCSRRIALIATNGFGSGMQ